MPVGDNRQMFCRIRFIHSFSCDPLMITNRTHIHTHIFVGTERKPKRNRNAEIKTSQWWWCWQLLLFDSYRHNLYIQFSTTFSIFCLSVFLRSHCYRNRQQQQQQQQHYFFFGSIIFHNWYKHTHTHKTFIKE